MGKKSKSPKISWDNSVPIFGRGVIGKQLFFALGLPFIVIFGGVAISSMVYAVKNGYPIFSRLDGLQYAMGMLGITGLLTFGIIYAMNHNRYLVYYEVSEDGIYEAYQEGQRKKNRKLNKAGMAAALLTGKPGLAGGAMLAQSRQQNFYAWSDISSFKEKPRRHTIEYRCGLVHCAVFCTKGNYNKVLSHFTKRVKSK